MTKHNSSFPFLVSLRLYLVPKTIKKEKNMLKENYFLMFCFTIKKNTKNVKYN